VRRTKPEKLMSRLVMCDCCAEWQSIAARSGLGSGDIEVQSHVLALPGLQHSGGDQTPHQYTSAVRLQPGVDVSAELEQVLTKSWCHEFQRMFRSTHFGDHCASKSLIVSGLSTGPGSCICHCQHFSRHHAGLRVDADLGSWSCPSGFVPPSQASVGGGAATAIGCCVGRR
jgi:hypothetical protein